MRKTDENWSEMAVKRGKQRADEKGELEGIMMMSCVGGVCVGGVNKASKGGGGWVES